VGNGCWAKKTLAFAFLRKKIEDFRRILEEYMVIVIEMDREVSFGHSSTRERPISGGDMPFESPLCPLKSSLIIS
jgi:hypothetical protein